MNRITDTASSKKRLSITWAAARVAGTILLGVLLCLCIGVIHEEIEQWLRRRYDVMEYPNVLRRPHQSLSLLGVSVRFLVAMFSLLLSVMGTLMITRWREPIAALAVGVAIYVAFAVRGLNDAVDLATVAYAFGVVVGAAIAVRLIWRRVRSARTAQKAVQGGEST
jgi:asparagine N-glycosylation enzyme membrane subunit Stt3